MMQKKFEEFIENIQGVWDLTNNFDYHISRIIVKNKKCIFLSTSYPNVPGWEMTLQVDESGFIYFSEDADWLKLHIESTYYNNRLFWSYAPNILYKWERSDVFEHRRRYGLETNDLINSSEP